METFVDKILVFKCQRTSYGRSKHLLLTWSWRTCPGHNPVFSAWIVFPFIYVHVTHHVSPHLHTAQLDTDDVTVENSMSKSFDQVIRMQLDPVWNQLVSKTFYLCSLTR